MRNGDLISAVLSGASVAALMNEQYIAAIIMISMIYYIYHLLRKHGAK